MGLWWIVIALLVLAVAFFVITYICFRMAFYAKRGSKTESSLSALPGGEAYEPYHECMAKWADECAKMPHEDFYITSFDGLTLHGKYYEYAPGAPIELMFHGYRGSAQRDLSGGVQRCFELQKSALIVDQRCSGESGGNVITFGIRESRDCLSWVDFMVDHFGSDVKIIITGISMGASTVLIAAGQPLPENVVGALADCGYNSAKDIIKKVIKQMGLPVDIGYFFVKLGAKIYGGFDLEETSPEAALASCKIPVIFFHGESDDFVPCEMSRINYDACPSEKKLVTIPSAAHGLAYLVDPDLYLKSIREFFK